MSHRPKGPEDRLPGLVSDFLVRAATVDLDVVDVRAQRVKGVDRVCDDVADGGSDWESP